MDVVDFPLLVERGLARGASGDFGDHAVAFFPERPFHIHRFFGMEDVHPGIVGGLLLGFFVLALVLFFAGVVVGAFAVAFEAGEVLFGFFPFDLAFELEEVGFLSGFVPADLLFEGVGFEFDVEVQQAVAGFLVADEGMHEIVFGLDDGLPGADASFGDFVEEDGAGDAGGDLGADALLFGFVDGLDEFFILGGEEFPFQGSAVVGHGSS